MPNHHHSEVLDAARGEEIASLRAQLQQRSADAATVVYALDAAVQLIGVLTAFAAPGVPLHPGVATAKAALDAAMANLRRPPEAQLASMTGAQIDKLAKHIDALMAALHNALTLTDAMLTHIAALPNLPMDVVVAKKQFDRAMAKLLAKP